MYYKTVYASPLGLLTAVSDENSLLGLWLEGQKHFCSSLKNVTFQSGATSVLAKTERWLDRYFSGKRPSPTELSLAPWGSEFRQGIWRLLCEIPYGETVTYGELAKRFAKEKGIPRMSAQAVGGAVEHNPISIIIPCHRVIGAGGALIGYDGGVEKKAWLLRHESKARI